MMASAKQTVVVAGSGDLARYIAEEFAKAGASNLVIITRTEQSFFAAVGIPLQIVTDYSVDTVRRVLDQVNASALISTLHTNNATYYTAAHTALLDACRQSKSCKRFVPSEFLGNSRDFPNVPRGIQRARHAFRETLLNESEIQWTFFNQGWLADYFVQTPDATRSYMRPFPEGWPIDLEAKTVRIVGTGDEPNGWTTARDAAKALNKLMLHDDWERETFVFGELGSWNQAIDIVEEFYNLKLKRTYVTKDDLDKSLSRPDEDEVWYTATIDEWSLVGATAVPREVALQQREKYFAGLHFRTIMEILHESETMQII